MIQCNSAALCLAYLCTWLTFQACWWVQQLGCLKYLWRKTPSRLPQPFKLHNTRLCIHWHLLWWEWMVIKLKCIICIHVLCAITAFGNGLPHTAHMGVTLIRYWCSLKTTVSVIQMLFRLFTISNQITNIAHSKTMMWYVHMGKNFIPRFDT